MPSLTLSHGRRVLAPIAAAGLLLAAFPDDARAQGFFEALFGGLGLRPARVAPLPTPAPWFSDEPQRRPVRRRPPKMELANLPPAQGIKLSTKPVTEMSDTERAATLLSDPTLRRGDIVVFPQGARVFRGEAGSSSHRMSDFEDVRSSRYVGQGTRRTVLAVTRVAPSMAVAPSVVASPRSIRRVPRIESDPVVTTGSVARTEPPR
jgi:hypothetical protein